ncbi:diguanylate cyclase [Arenimonas sp.]|uniref:diguanylate cyclase domain-containing protein n=1 Tax=Arenimonas sp. TaxID=1872635 RepID=UPI0025C415CB|nr:diguanylate cyclase [Arenimonas sp.]
MTGQTLIADAPQAEASTLVASAPSGGGPAPGLRAEHLRELLEAFRRDLHDVPHDHRGLSEEQRQLAYQRLSDAAHSAARIAESAVHSLDLLVRATQRDPLTDTPNRTLMLDRIGSALALAQRRSARLAVMFVDLDHFKRVNDSQGHAFGDEVLRCVARRLQSVVRDSDTVSRFGGDEFVVLLPEISCAADAGAIAAKMLDALALPGEPPADHAGVLASIGISLYPEDGDQVPVLLEAADAAMYRAKADRGSRYRFHADSPGEARARGRGEGDEARRAESDQDLRQSNERFVLTVLGKAPVDAESEAMHARRVRFLAMVAHELRYPLAPIRKAADLARRASGDEAGMERLHRAIEKQVLHMARRVDDLLDDGRAGGQRFRMASVPVDVCQVLRDVAEAWQPAITLRGHALALQLPEGALWVRGDPDRLAQVLVNLLDNACRYTPAGGRLRLVARRARGRVTIQLVDNGMGLPEDLLECIFDLFARGPDAMAVHRGGLGIGLAVARELVEAHGGRIAARSRGEHRGSTFDVSLPCLAATPG